MSSVSKEHANSVPHGNSEHAAAIRMPDGPSVMVIGGTPFSRSDFVTPPMTPALPFAPSGLSMEKSPRASPSESDNDKLAANSSSVSLPAATSCNMPSFPCGKDAGRAAKISVFKSFVRAGQAENTPSFCSTGKANCGAQRSDNRSTIFSSDPKLAISLADALSVPA